MEVFSLLEQKGKATRLFRSGKGGKIFWDIVNRMEHPAGQPPSPDEPDDLVKFVSGDDWVSIRSITPEEDYPNALDNRVKALVARPTGRRRYTNPLDAVADWKAGREFIADQWYFTISETKRLLDAGWKYVVFQTGPKDFAVVALEEDDAVPADL